MLNQKRISRKRQMNSFVFSAIYFVVTFIYIEIVFHITEFHDALFIFPVLFAIPIGLVFAFVTDLFPEKVSKILRYALSAVVMTVFGVQIVYFHSFQAFMSMSQVGMGGDVFKNFFESIVIAVWESKLSLILTFLPLAVLALVERRVRPENRFNWKKSGLIACCFIVTQFIAVSCLPLGGKADHTAYDNYHNNWVLDLSVEKLGLITTTGIDLKYLFLGDSGFEDDPPITLPSVTLPPDNETNGPILGSDETTDGGEQWENPYNTIEGLDFEALAAEATDETVKNMFTYLASLEPTKKNEYTGMFEGYNLIMLTAESFSPVAVDKELTPTLYKLVNSGFVFENYWNMYPSNTTNGEYSVLTGLAPDFEKPKKDGSFLYTAKNNITMNLTAAAYFNGAGVTSRAFHNNTKTYYGRNETHPNLGFVFKGEEDIGGLKGNITSDLVMVQRTIGDYINDDRFFAYYMTYSGHHNYIFKNHYIANQNKNLVDHLDADESAKAYLACHIELDRALEYLITELEKAGKLEKTVICLSADHYPYGLSDAQYKAMLGHNYKYDRMERYCSNLIIWNSEMETVKVSKPCCQVDILPTLLNLFGFEYDSRLYTGSDILSDSYGLAMLSNQSFVTDKVVYNSRYQKTYKLDKSFTVPDGYIEAYLQIVKNRYSIAANILNKDFYAKLPQDIIKAALEGK